MAVSDQDRLDLHGRLEEVLGQGHGSTLMAHLPPRGGAEMATKQDVEVFGARFTAELDHEVDLHGAKVDRAEAMLTVAALAATTSVIVAAVRP